MKSWVLFISLMVSGLCHAGNIVSVDGSLTEIIYQLGAEQRLAGVDTTSTYPAAAKELPQVGYMRQLSAEGILSLQPKTVIASTDAGPAEVFTQLRAAGVEVVTVKADNSVAGVLSKVRQVAAALDLTEQGEALAERLEQQINTQLQRVGQNPAPQVLLLMGAGGRGLMAAGSGTKAQAMLEMVGARNVIAYPGYKPVNAEAAVQAAPEVIIVANTGAEQQDEVASMLAMTPAARHQAVHGIDAALLLGFGPRLPQALDELITLLQQPALVQE